MRSAFNRSSKPSSRPVAVVRSNPPVNVERYGRYCAASAVMLPESMPPLRYAPSGTSATSCRSTAWRNSRSSSSAYSSSELPSSCSVKSKSQYVRSRREPSRDEIVSVRPGGTRRTPSKSVPSEKMFWNGKNSRRCGRLGFGRARGGAEPGVREEALDLRREEERLADVGDIERLDPVAVAREEDLAAAPV